MKIYKLFGRECKARIVLVGLILISIVSFIFLATALTDDERTNLQAELSSLSSELSGSDYSWLVDYNLTYPTIEVYENNQDRLIATFSSIISEGFYKIFLTDISDDEGYSQDVFDLLIKNGSVERMDYEILQKKIRLDEIRRELK